MTSDFCRAFEERQRRTREQIRARRTLYLPFVRPLARLLPESKVTDLRCGHGEWLELLRDEKIPAHGIDLDEEMLRTCRHLGLTVSQGDPFEYLSGQPDASQTVVSAFRVAERLPFEPLAALTQEAFRVLRPGGILILETLNPENLVVGTSGFYTDPSHQRPLPPPLLAFLAEFQGFRRVKLLRLDDPEVSQEAVSVLDVLAGVAPYYAVVAQKAFGEDLPDHVAAFSLEAAFSREHGMTLQEVARRYEQQSSGRIADMQSTIEAMRESHAHVVERMVALEQKLQAQAHWQEQVQAIYQSRSWRITRPLRWATEQSRALREQGPRLRARRLAAKLLRIAVGGPVRLVMRHPRARRLAVGALRGTGLDQLAVRTWARLNSPQVESDNSLMTRSARRVHARLQLAVLRAKTPKRKH